MIRGKIVPIRDADFTPYGRYFDLRRERMTETEKYTSYMSVDPAVTRPLRLGITVCENPDEFEVDSMERHMSTEEVLFAGAKPIVLSLADSDPMGAPKAEDVVSFLMEPGDLVVLKRGIWHDACHAMEDRTLYYFLSYSNGDPSETAWINVVPEPVVVNRKEVQG